MCRKNITFPKSKWNSSYTSPCWQTGRKSLRRRRTELHADQRGWWYGRQDRIIRSRYPNQGKHPKRIQDGLRGDSIDLGYPGINSRRGRVGHEIAHTLTTGNQQGTLHFVDISPPPLVTDVARCLNTRQDSSIHNHRGESSGVLVEEPPRAVLTPAREKVRQNGRRMKEPEEPMFTITATDRHGVIYHGRIRS